MMPEEKIEKELFSWSAPARPFKRRDREYYVTLLAIASIVGLVLFIAEGAMPVILLAALVFLYYILNTVEPESVGYKISTWGIRVANVLNPWENLRRFWFSERRGNWLLVLETNGLSGRLELVINQDDLEKLRENLKEYLPEEKITPSFFDKTVDWVSQRLPNNQ